MERLTARSERGQAFLVNIKENEQRIDCMYKRTLQCILDSFNRLAELEDKLESGELVEVVRCKDCKYTDCCAYIRMPDEKRYLSFCSDGIAKEKANK